MKEGGTDGTLLRERDARRVRKLARSATPPRAAPTSGSSRRSGPRSARATTTPSTPPGSRPATGFSPRPTRTTDRASRCRLTLWASVCYATSYHPLYGTPVDPRLLAAFRKQIAAFDAGLALLPHPVAPLRIPFEGTTLPGYFLPAVGHEDETRPLVICTNGYDATVTEMYFACAVPAARRGFHSLFFDGPGQGEMLIEHAMPMRPDWEKVIRAVVDFALTLPNVDPGASRSPAGASAATSRSAPRAASRASPPASPTPASAPS